MSHDIVTLQNEPHLEEQVQQLHREAWPEFLRHSAVGNYWRSLYATFAPFQLAIRHAAGSAIAVGNAIPITWDGTVDGLPSGMVEIFKQAIGEHDRRPTTLSALSIIVAHTHRGQGLSKTVLRAMQSIGLAHGLRSFIAPVRPTLKPESTDGQGWTA